MIMQQLNGQNSRLLELADKVENNNVEKDLADIRGQIEMCKSAELQNKEVVEGQLKALREQTDTNIANVQAFKDSMTLLSEEITRLRQEIIEVKRSGDEEVKHLRNELSKKSDEIQELQSKIKTVEDKLYYTGGVPLVREPVRREAPKVGRNDPCPCGSGKKYKKCCGKNA